MSNGKDWKVDDQTSDAQRFRKKGLMAAMVCWCGEILAEHWLAGGILELSIEHCLWDFSWALACQQGCAGQLVLLEVANVTWLHLCLLAYSQHFHCSPERLRSRGSFKIYKLEINALLCLHFSEMIKNCGWVDPIAQTTRSSKLRHSNGVKAAFIEIANDIQTNLALSQCVGKTRK